MQKWNRRDVLASLGIASGAALFSGCGGKTSGDQGGSAGAGAKEGTQRVPSTGSPAAASPAPGDTVPRGSPATLSWSYQPLDPATTAEIAYQMYPQGSCMYAVFGSVLSQLADKVGEPFRSFPLEMMRFGATGIGGWGSVCGVVNGCAALIGLFHNEQKDKRREELISDICLWYESTLLPRFQPANPAGVAEVGSAQAGSVLCHVSVSQWCKATGCDAYSAERRERCRRLSCDGVMKVVELLNNGVDGSGDFFELTQETHACIECHGKNDRADSLGQMSCASCHQFDRAHP